MSWNISELDINNHLFITITMDEGTHIMACLFVQPSELGTYNLTTSTIIDPDFPERKHHAGDHILIALAGHSGNSNNTITLPASRLIDNSNLMNLVCMVLVHKEDDETYKVKRVKRTTNKVSDGYPKSRTN